MSYFILTGFDITPEISNALEEKVIYECFRNSFKISEIDEFVQQAVQPV